MIVLSGDGGVSFFFLSVYASFNLKSIGGIKDLFLNPNQLPFVLMS